MHYRGIRFGEHFGARLSETVANHGPVVPRRGHSQVGFDNVALWHERDISHSSAERVVLADSTIGLDYLLGKLEWILDGLVLYPERMQANLDATRGLIYSSGVLLALVDSGMTREDAYAVVQGAAMKVWADIQQAEPGPGFRDYLVSSSIEEFPLDFAQMEQIFDPRSFLTRTGVLFERVEALEF